jgi:hypothetical protein
MFGCQRDSEEKNSEERNKREKKLSRKFHGFFFLVRRKFHGLDEQKSEKRETNKNGKITN